MEARVPLVSQSMIQAVFDYLNEQGDASAQAHADLILAEFRRKKCRAALIFNSTEKTMGMREAEAECHPDYEEACVVEAKCAERVAWHRHQKSRADAICDAWRTEQSTNRSLSRVA